MSKYSIIITILAALFSLDTNAAERPDSLDKELDEVVVNSAKMLNMKSYGVENKDIIGKQELFRAACCNLGESFTNNPSVDVSYTDAATGSKQIKLLGLSGTYVQMMTENIPTFRGAASPYALGYVPGPWMQSIQVSKGASSVKNGYESITGQINIEYIKPQLEDHLNVNLYGNTMAKAEANVDGSIHLNDKWSTGLMLHYEDQYANHDGNGDGFQDLPRVRQYHGLWRWGFFSEKFISQFGVNALKENRMSGQMNHTNMDTNSDNAYKIDIETERYEAFAKNAFVFNQEHNTNLALILSATFHNQNAEYGANSYNVKQREIYGNLIFEHDFSDMHKLSTGLSFNQDHYNEDYSYESVHGRLWGNQQISSETVKGAYAQYTLNINDKLVFMAGIRADHSNQYGWFATPRTHIKWAPTSWFSFRASAGKGYHSVHALAENNYLLASSRKILFDEELKREEAWNYGTSAAFNIPLFNKKLQLNAEYYYTDFINQLIIDREFSATQLHFYNLKGKSYSHVFQIDATYPVFEGFTLTAAYRFTDAKTTYGGTLMERPLTSRFKGLVSLNYETPLGLWMYDLTLQINGGGRMPTPFDNKWESRYKTFPQLQAQITRVFRHFDVYIGGENLTNVKQKNPIIDAINPWGNRFDATMVWGPVHGALGYVGVRVKL